MIKKLTKAELAEGLTPAFVNSVNIDKCCSPAQMEPGDEPVKLLVARKGYTVIVGVHHDGKYERPILLKDAQEHPIIFRRRQVHIARARYLMNFDKRDRARKVRYIVEACRLELGQKLIEIEAMIKQCEQSITDRVAQRLQGKGMPFRSVHDQEITERLNKLSKLHKLADLMWQKNDHMGMLSYLSQFYKFPSFNALIRPFIEGNIPDHTLRQYARMVVDKEHQTYFHINQYTNVTKSENVEACH